MIGKGGESLTGLECIHPLILKHGIANILMPLPNILGRSNLLHHF